MHTNTSDVKLVSSLNHRTTDWTLPDESTSCLGEKHKGEVSVREWCDLIVHHVTTMRGKSSEKRQERRETTDARQ